jgi:hypothetical protein
MRGVRVIVGKSGAVHFDLFKSHGDNWVMEPKPIRTSIDLPRDLHRRLREAAARKGCSARKLMLEGIERAVTEVQPSRPVRRLDFDNPPFPRTGRPINLTNEEIYDLIEFP